MDCLESLLSCVRNGAGIHILSAGQQIVSHCAISYLEHDCVNAVSTACCSLALKHESDACWAYGRKFRKLNFNSTGPITSRHIYCPVTARHLPMYLTSWSLTTFLLAFLSPVKVKWKESKGKKPQLRKKPESPQTVAEGSLFWNY